MRILLTNDDGIHAPGFAALERLARTLSDDVWFIAPLEENSGAGHSLTLSRPLRIQKFGERRFGINGTPTDCVMMALANLMKDHRPDLILSGVNRGANLGEDVTYSGTVSAAMEGALAGVPSIALSQAIDRTTGSEVPAFETALTLGPKLLATLTSRAWQPGTLLNVNFPALPTTAVKGTRLCRLGRRNYGRLKIDRRTDPRGFNYYWFGLADVASTPTHNSDLEVIAANYISVTPLHLDLTHDPSMMASSFVDEEF